jgi:hypothetical protein
MASLEMKGPFDLTNDEIDDKVTKTSPGNYALGRLSIHSVINNCA